MPNRRGCWQLQARGGKDLPLSRRGFSALQLFATNPRGGANTAPARCKPMRRAFIGHCKQAEEIMISGIGGSPGYLAYPACGGASGASSTDSASSLAQTEEKLFAAIDANGDGSISQTEMQSFFNQVSAATGNSQ